MISIYNPYYNVREGEGEGEGRGERSLVGEGGVRPREMLERRRN